MATDGGATEKDMICCSDCCFFRSDAWCYKKLRYVPVDGSICHDFKGGASTKTIDELTAELNKFIQQAETKPREAQKKADDRPKCLSCGKLLYIERRGRDGYCAECGCYIPQIMYDRRFADADKTMKPMSIPRRCQLLSAVGNKENR